MPFLASGSVVRLGSRPQKRINYVRMTFEYSLPTSQESSYSFGYLVLVDSLTLKTSLGTGNPYQLISCTVSADSEVTPFWKNDHTSSMFLPLSP